MAMIDALAHSELFGHLQRQHLETLANRSRGFTFAAGDTIFREGDEATEVYILTEGRVALEIGIRPVADRPALPTTVELVTENECFGWSPLVEPHVYTASARCLAPCTVIALKGDVLRKAMSDDPAMGYQVMGKLAQMVSRRLARTRMRLTTGLGLVLRGEDSDLSGVPDSRSA